MEIKFGTDGWRAIIAEDFTVQNVRYCTQALAEHLIESEKASQGIVIGYDTRFASERFAASAAEVMAGNGIPVFLCSGTAPTPMVSFGTRYYDAAGGIVITASHNPPEWNGFKIKDGSGASAAPAIEADIEHRIPEIVAADRFSRLPLVEGIDDKLISWNDLYPAYSERIGQLVDLKGIAGAGFKIIVDSMYGAGSGYFKKLAGEGSTVWREIHGERNPIFPGIKQPEPIAANLTELATTVKESGADVGLATDGDADRLGIVDENGLALTPLQIFGLLALYLLEVQGQRGAIVRTITTTSMVNRLAEQYGVPVFETGVGFKHVAPIMVAEDALIGGEESSGFGFRGHVPERDGLLAGLFFLDLMSRTGRKPSELVEHLYSRVGPHHYHREDIVFPSVDRQKISDRLIAGPYDFLGGSEIVEVKTIDGFHFSFRDHSWLLIRFSGTEPLLRVYSEAKSLSRAKELVSAARNWLKV
ncbi:MAG: phosphoglucomutase/phosphomannomutase family protein [Dehalococcoidia bacterium]